MLSTKMSTLQVKYIVAVARAANTLSVDGARMEDGGFEEKSVVAGGSRVTHASVARQS